MSRKSKRFSKSGDGPKHLYINKTSLISDMYSQFTYTGLEDTRSKLQKMQPS